jgi:hypothetical protein
MNLENRVQDGMAIMNKWRKDFKKIVIALVTTMRRKMNMQVENTY